MLLYSAQMIYTAFHEEFWTNMGCNILCAVKTYRHLWQQLEQILSPDYNPYSNSIRLFLAFQISFLSSDFVLSLGEGWKHVSDQSEHTLLNFLTIRTDLAKKGEGNGRKKLTNKTPVNDGGNTVSLVLVLCEELPLFSLYSLDPRGLQLGNTSGLSSCKKRWNWAGFFWVVGVFFASASTPGK